MSDLFNCATPPLLLDSGCINPLLVEAQTPVVDPLVIASPVLKRRIPANRLIEDVIQRQQTGARMKLYIDRVVVSGTVNDTSSRFINVPVILTSASLTVNPDDGKSVAINFRPSEAPTFDLSKSS